MARKWESLGATEHAKFCHGQFDWLSLMRKNL